MIYDKIYLDMDGVLADFATAAEHVLGRPMKEYENEHGPARAWREIYSVPGFFLGLKPLPHCSLIVDLCRRHSKEEICILSSPSRTNRQECIEHKRHWLATHIGPETAMIFENRKFFYAKPGHLLIDDTLSKVEGWIDNGGPAHLFTTYGELVSFLK